MIHAVMSPLTFLRAFGDLGRATRGRLDRRAIQPDERCRIDTVSSGNGSLSLAVVQPRGEPRAFAAFSFGALPLAPHAPALVTGPVCHSFRNLMHLRHS